MSGWTKEEMIEAKDARRGVIDQPTGKGKSKRDTPIRVEYRFTEGFWGKLWGSGAWRLKGNYRDMATAEQAIKQHQHKHARLKPEFRIIDKRETQ